MAYNKITLCGKQTCNYLYIQTNDLSGTSETFDDIAYEPTKWEKSTSLYANFNDSERRLNAGDSALIGDITGYGVYRRKYNESHAEYVTTIQESKEFIVDYAVKNGVEYVYYLYPNNDVSEGGAVLSPIITKPLATDIGYWSLFVVDDTEEENVFYLDKMFKFELNLQVDSMSNNAQISITQNFTKYPTIQYGASNYWSGSLSSLCGFIACNDVDYIQTTNIIDELKAISSDTRRKFLKDTDGNLWEVDVSAPIEVSTENTTLQSVKTWKFSWAEVGDANGISIVNNPNKDATEWVLTQNGEALPYVSYVWDNQRRWDNSYRWTSNSK